MTYQGKRLEDLTDAELDAFKDAAIAGAEQAQTHFALMCAAYEEWVEETRRRKKALVN